MPTRSNEFQRLIYFIQLHLAEDASVTESAMLRDSHTGRLREVDVVVRGTVAGSEVIISIECRDRRRAEDVTWVEQEHAKHSRLPTNKLVLVSSSGFTGEAQRVAELHGIHLVVPGEPGEDENAAREVVGMLAALWAKRADLTITGVEVIAGGANEPVIHSFVLLSDVLLDARGRTIGTIKSYADSVLREGPGDDMRDVTGDVTVFTMEVDDPRWLVRGESEASPLFVDAEINGERRSALVTRFVITGDAKVVVTEVPLTHGQYEDTPFSYGEATTVSGEPVSLFVSETPTQRRLTLRYGPQIVPLGDPFPEA